MRTKKIKLGVVTVTLGTLLLAVGCGEDDVQPATDDGRVTTVDDPEASDSVDAEEETVLPSDEDVESYFTAVATYAVDDLETAMNLVEPGSIAEAYAGYILATANAAIDGGSPSREWSRRRSTADTRPA